MEYTFIEDLPENWQSFAVPELANLSAVWKEQKRKLDARALAEFQEKLSRQFAIETGLLENLYVLDRGTTELLIEQGLISSLIPDSATQSGEEVSLQLHDHRQALDGLLDFVANTRALTPDFIKTLHSQLTQHQSHTKAKTPDGRYRMIQLLRGKFKEQSNNPTRPDGIVHHYCPPEHVEAEMDILVNWHAQHVEQKVAPEVEAAWLHHRFTQIHPFQDGNGRVARCLANLVLLKEDWLPLAVLSQQRKQYIEALEYADAGNLGPLVDIFAGIQKEKMQQALGLAEEATTASTSSQIIQSAKELLLQRRQSKELKLLTVKRWAEEFAALAHQSLQNAADELNRSLGELLSPDFARAFSEQRAQGDRNHWHRQDVIEIAARNHYFANLGDFHVWARLTLTAPGTSDLVVSFHTPGKEFVGTIFASAFYLERDSDNLSRTVVSCANILQFNYQDGKAAALQRFSDWLESAKANGLEQWRRGL